MRPTEAGEEYNARGKTTKTVDPLGREMVYLYGTNNVPNADPHSRHDRGVAPAGGLATRCAALPEPRWNDSLPFRRGEEASGIQQRNPLLARQPSPAEKSEHLASESEELLGRSFVHIR
jgi:hypothetical protein